MEPLERELQCAGALRYGIVVQVEPTHEPLDEEAGFGRTLELPDEVARAHLLRRLGDQALVERRREGRGVLSTETVMPHLEQRASESTLEYLRLTTLLEHVELDSTDGGGDDRVEVHRARNRERLAAQHGPTHCTGGERLERSDREPHRHTRALIHLRGGTQLRRELGDAFLEMPRDSEFDIVGLSEPRLLVHDRDLVFDAIW